MAPTSPARGPSDELVVRIADAATPAGRRVEVPVELVNGGPAVVGVRVWVVGLEASWAPASAVDVRLEPGQTVVVDIALTPPAGAVAGEYPWSLALDVVDAAGRPAGRPRVLPAVLRVDERPRVSVGLVPAEVTAWRRGKVGVVLDNHATTPTQVRLRATSTEGGTVDLPDGPTTVPASGSVRLTARVRVRRPALFGSRRRFPWSVETDSESAPSYAEGVVVARPLFPGSLVRAVAVLAVLALWIGALSQLIPALSNRATTAALTSSTVTPSSSASSGSGSDGSGGSGSGGSGSGDSGSASGGSGTGGPVTNAAAGITRFTGIVTGPEVAGVAVTLEQVSLADTRLQGLTTVSGTTPVSGGSGKLSASAVGRFAVGAVSHDVSHPTDKYGAWTFNDVASPGYYLLTFARPGLQEAKYVVDSSDPASAQPMKVALATAQGTITGRVVGPSGAALGGATVTVTDGTVTVTTSTLSTGADVGKFAVTKALSTPGTYLVSASKPGYALGSVLVTLSAGGSSDVRLTLQPGVETLTGTVWSTAPGASAGHPDGAVITATNGGITRTVTAATTTPVGHYTLENLPLGTWTVTASAPGFLAQTTRRVLDGSSSSSVFSPTLQPSTSTVEGTVTSSADGAPLVGAGVTLTGPGGTFKVTSGSAPAGGYVFTGIPPGTYTVTSTYFGYADRTASVDATQVTKVARVNLPMDVSSTGGPESTSRITGTTLDGFSLAPVDCGTGPVDCVRTTVSAAADPTKVLASTSSTPTSPYIVPATNATGLPPGLYQITVSAPKYEPTTTLVRVGTGQTVTAPQVLLFPYASIKGTIGTRGPALPSLVCVVAAPITSADRNPLKFDSTASCAGPATPPTAAPHYSCPASTGGYFCATVAADGTYTLPDLPRGSYQIAVVPADPAFLPIPPSTITLAPGQVGRFDATLDRLGALMVTVRKPNPADPSAAAVVVPGAIVTVTPVPAGTVVTGTTCAAGDPAPCTPNGSVPLGTAYIDRLEAGVYDVSVNLSGGLSATARVSVSRNTVIPVSLVALAAPSTLLGRVVWRLNGADQAVPNTPVIVTYTAGFDSAGTAITTQVGVTTDAQGCFAVLPPNTPYPTPGTCTFTAANTVVRTIANSPVLVSVPATIETSGVTLKASADGVLGDVVVPAQRRPVSVTLTATTPPASWTAATVTVSGPLEAGSLSATVDTTGKVTVLDSLAGGAVNALLPGHYTFDVRLAGYAPRVVGLDVGSTAAPAPLSIPLLPLVDVVLTVGYDIPLASGTAPTTRVTLTLGNQQTVQTRVGGGSAPFTFAGLVPVDTAGNPLTYTLLVQADGYTDATLAVPLTDAASGVVAVTLVRQSAITLGLTQVVGSATSALPGATVTATGPGGTYTATTGATGVAFVQGTLAHNGLAAGTYAVTVTPPPGYKAIVYPGGATSFTCTVDALNRTCALTATTSPTPIKLTVAVRAGSTTGTSVQGVTVTLSTSDPLLLPGGVTNLVVTDGGTGDADGTVNGNVVFASIVPSSYGVHVSAASYAPLATTTTLSVGADVTLTYALSTEFNTVDVVVTAGGKAVTGATVTLTNGTTTYTATELPQGKYQFTKVVSGDYTLTVDSTKYQTYTQTVTVVGGGVLTFQVLMTTKVQDVVVTLTNKTTGVPLDGSKVCLRPLTSSTCTQAPVGVSASGKNTWQATFSQVPYDTYVAVYVPTPGTLHYGAAESAGTPVAAGSNLTKPVAISLTVDEHAVNVLATTSPTGSPLATTTWTKPDTTALDAGRVGFADGTATTYYLPSSTSATDSTGTSVTTATTGTWKVTVTPSDPTAYLDGSASLSMAASGPTPATLTVPLVAPATALVSTVGPKDAGGTAIPVGGVDVTAKCPATAAAVTVTSDATTGIATFTGLRPGVSCQFAAAGVTGPLWPVVAGTNTVTPPIDVSASLTVSVDAPDTGTGTGTTPVTGVNVSVVCTNGGVTAPAVSATTVAGSATFTRTLLPGTCAVTVSPASAPTVVLGTGSATLVPGGTGTAAVHLPTAIVTLTQTSAPAGPVATATVITATCGPAASPYVATATTSTAAGTVGQAAFVGTLPPGSCTFSDGGTPAVTATATLTGGTRTAVSLVRP